MPYHQINNIQMPFLIIDDSTGEVIYERKRNVYYDMPED